MSKRFIKTFPLMQRTNNFL